MSLVTYWYWRGGSRKSRRFTTMADAVAAADMDHNDGTAAFDSICVGNVVWLDHGRWLSGLIDRCS